MTQKINCKFSDIVIVPYEALDIDSARYSNIFVTNDGVSVEASFQTVWKNTDGRYDDEIDDACIKHWDLPFKTIRSIFISRLGSVGDVWYLIKLKKI